MVFNRTLRNTGRKTSRSGRASSRRNTPFAAASMPSSRAGSFPAPMPCMRPRVPASSPAASAGPSACTPPNKQRSGAGSSPAPWPLTASRGRRWRADLRGNTPSVKAGMSPLPGRVPGRGPERARTPACGAAGLRGDSHHRQGWCSREACIPDGPAPPAPPVSGRGTAGSKPCRGREVRVVDARRHRHLGTDQRDRCAGASGPVPRLDAPDDLLAWREREPRIRGRSCRRPICRRRPAQACVPESLRDATSRARRA